MQHQHSRFSMTRPVCADIQTVDGLEPFSEFFEGWLAQQNRDLQDLISESTRPGAESTRYLVDRVMSHYETYYRVKRESEKRNSFEMLNPPWRSTLEDAFLWIGGWRPTMAFHLLYSKSGIQLEAGLTELLNGLSTNDLADLSASQLARIDDLHRKTVQEEKKLTESMAAVQETVADSSMVQLSQAVTELINSETESMEERVDSVLGSKEKEMGEVMGEADDLRLTTLKRVVGILSPIQAVHFLIAAAELHLRVHEWGKKKDDKDSS